MLKPTKSIWSFVIGAVAVMIISGCATGKQIALDPHQWGPENVEFTFPSGGWHFRTSLTSLGSSHEHYDIYERRLLFWSVRSEHFTLSSYMPKFVGTPPAEPLEAFNQSTNSLSKSSALSVNIIERTTNAITWTWSSINKNGEPSLSGIEKNMTSNGGTYRLSFTYNAGALSSGAKQDWISAVKDAKLSPK